MDLKALLGKLDVLEGSMEKASNNPTGPKFTGQWRGTDKAPPGKKLVGDSMLKDLSKGPTPKTKEQELSEEFQAFLEAEFKDTVDKRPGRKSDRPSRGHEPQPRYKTIKADEGWESGPEEYEEPYDDADDAYERQRQEKIDTEAEKEWAKLPKVSTYKLTGRGPNMEPNWDFGGTEYPSQEAAIEARAKLMADPNTPNPRDIGIQTITRVVDKQQTNEAFYNAPKNKEDYDAKMTALQDLQMDPNTANDPELQKKIIIYMDNLQKIAHQKGWLAQPAEESRGHKIVANKLKDIERAKKFASGELKIPTPQERQAQLKKLEKEPKQVKEYGANTISPYGLPTKKVDPKQMQQVAANLNKQKTALSQLQQMNTEIDPSKAAAALTKDPATMSPQEKEAVIQVAKTVSPALGTPAFGSLKTAIQKSQVR